MITSEWWNQWNDKIKIIKNTTTKITKKQEQNDQPTVAMVKMPALNLYV